MRYYPTSLQHILAELERIDLLIRMQVARARQLHDTDDEFQGLYISEREVDELAARPVGLPPWATTASPSDKSSRRGFSQLVWRQRVAVFLRLKCSH